MEVDTALLTSWQADKTKNKVLGVIHLKIPELVLKPVAEEAAWMLPAELILIFVHHHVTYLLVSFLFPTLSNKPVSKSRVWRVPRALPHCFFSFVELSNYSRVERADSHTKATLNNFTFYSFQSKMTLRPAWELTGSPTCLFFWERVGVKRQGKRKQIWRYWCFVCRSEQMPQTKKKS